MSLSSALTAHEAVRPPTFDAFVGQAKIKERLTVSIDRAIEDHRPLDHVFLDGGPGSGKTTLAALIAQRMTAKMAVLSQPAPPLKVARTLWDVDADSDDRVVLFIDEVHAWRKETDINGLLTLLEEGYIETRFDRFHFRHVTAVLATTEKQMLRATLLDRAPIKLRFVDYSAEEMTTIVKGMADRLGVRLGDGVAVVLAGASAGVPRIARELVLAARDLGDAPAQRILDFCDRYADGLSGEHLRYLHTLADTSGGQAGVETLAGRLGLAERAVKDLEKLLLDRHYIARDRAIGRVLTAAGRRRLTTKEL